MKRAAAIVGPSPSFIRWAIKLDCPFRQSDQDSLLPWQTYQQLRGLREVSVGQVEERVVDGICIHAERHNDPETALGFPVQEITRFFGDENLIRESCTLCPANVSCIRSTGQQTERARKVWAGCYGWLASRSDSCDLVERLERAVRGRESDLLSSLPTARRAWFRIWQVQIWDSNRLETLVRILDLLAANLISGEASADFKNLQLASEACLEHRLDLVTELIPQGHSDGVVWQIEPHCSNCNCEMSAGDRKCYECGRNGHPNPSVTRKVLGLRPYMLLRDLLGLEETAILLSKFQKTRNL